MQTERTERVNRKTKVESRDWVVLHCRTMDEVEDAVRNKRFIHSHIMRGVRRMIERRATTDMCLEILCATTGTSFWISVKLDEIDEVLGLILQYREEREEYEECGEVVRLLSECKALKGELKDSKKSNTRRSRKNAADSEE